MREKLIYIYSIMTNISTKHHRKALIISIFLFLFLSMVPTLAQSSRPFCARIYNKEYRVFIRMNAYEQNITVPGQEIFGEMAGYFRSDEDARYWLFTDMELAPDSLSAMISITNDYGSEDLTASLTLQKDGTYKLKQLEGSTLKIARNRKWVKMPKELIFVRQ